MSKSCTVVISILLLIIAALVFKFVIQGDIKESSDGRTAILLDEAEKNLVLGEMRIFLQSVQQITSAVVNDDMDLAVEAARLSGSNAQAAVPGTLVAKLPLSFKQLGFDTHAKFDQLALDASQLGDPDHALTQLDELLQNCVACHATYRFELAKD